MSDITDSRLTLINALVTVVLIYVGCSESNASPFFSMEIATKSTITLFDRANSQLQNTVF